jgi:transposase
MGPESAKSFPGRALVPLQAPVATALLEPSPPAPVADPSDVTGPALASSAIARPAGRAIQEIDYGRRGKGYIFGAFKPADGEALTAPYEGRTTANYVDFLEQVEAWIAPDIEHIYAIMDNLSAHRATDVLLFSLAHPRWEFVFQPKYAPYLNLIEPWWKVLRSLALKGRRFEMWAEICRAVHEATAYGNAHRHPFIWGRRRRHQPCRRPGIGRLPKAA